MRGFFHARLFLSADSSMHDMEVPAKPETYRGFEIISSVSRDPDHQEDKVIYLIAAPRGRIIGFAHSVDEAKAKIDRIVGADVSN